MNKLQLGPQTSTFPAPVVLVGANVDGRPNFMTAAWAATVNMEPPTVVAAVRHSRYTHKGIMQNLTFSVNVPSVDLAPEADYCGTVSGAGVDKAETCRFKVFYGKLKDAPLIEECPVNLECKVLHTLDLGSHTLFVGRVEETHVSEDCLTGGKLDFAKARPIVYSARRYQTIGQVLGKHGALGKAFKSKD